MDKIKITLKQIRRTPYQALAAIMVMFLTFFAISIFTLLALGSIKILKHFESAPQTIAFFEKGKDLSQKEVEKIKAELEATEKLASFKYTSTREAEAIYRENNKDDPLLLELVSYKILPPSIEISATEIEALPKLNEILKEQSGVKDVKFYEDVVSILGSWIKNIRIFGFSLVAYLLVQSILVIITITGMKIMFKKEEIEILKLIGADNWYIRWPFVLEGIFYGVTSAVLAWLASYTLLLYSTPFIVSWLSEISLLPAPIPVMLTVLGAEVLGGSIIGFIGSFLAVHRFLKK